MPPSSASGNKKLLQFSDLMATYDPAKNISNPVITKYEISKVVGMRTEQLARGAKPHVEWTEGMSARDVAEAELREKRMPLVLLRHMPSGKTEMLRTCDSIMY